MSAPDRDEDKSSSSDSDNDGQPRSPKPAMDDSTRNLMSEVTFSVKPYAGPNPFLTLTDHTRLYERVKMFLMTISGIVLLRIILFILSILLMWFFAKLALLCRGDKRGRPLGALRSIFIYPIRGICRFILFFSGFYWIPTSFSWGCCRDSQPHYNIVVANHCSLFDQFYLVYKLGCGGAAKAELFKMPLFGTIFAAVQCLPVYRKSVEGRTRSLNDIVERSRNKAGFPPLLIFPEGTTSNHTVLTTFKRGAFWAGENVLPVALDYSSNRNHDLYLGDNGSLYWYLYLAFCQIVNFVRIDFLDVYVPTEVEKKQPLRYAANVQSLIARHLKVPTTSHSYDDVRLKVLARKLRIPVDFVMEEAQAALGGLEFNQIESLAVRFREMDIDDDGYLNQTDFCNGLKVPLDSSIAGRLFSFFDADHNNKIDFREFIGAIAVSATGVSEVDSLTVLFQISDHNADGLVSRKGFAELVEHVVGFVPETENSDGKRCRFLTKSESMDMNTMVEQIFPKDGPNELSYWEFLQRVDKFPDFGRALLRWFMLAHIGGLEDVDLMAPCDTEHEHLRDMFVVNA